MKKRSLSGSVGIGVFLVGFVCICVAFATSSWLVSDYRITGAKLDKLGLWTHCFRSLGNVEYGDNPTKYFAGCRWVYDPFTKGYDRIKPFLMPPFMVATQFFFTLALLTHLISFGLVLLFFLCCDPEQKRFVLLIRVIGYLLIAGGICGCLAVIIFASLGNADDWMPGHANNYLGWSFGVGVVGSFLALIAGTLFLVEAGVQFKKRNYLKESQLRFQLESRA